ncbi:MAG TPA: thiamine phosphate synthase, partial [Thermoanaerobaculia bacterium]|nr:thiamine phosphate synthase [Thermoanaerobaculia bacterium]
RLGPLYAIADADALGGTPLPEAVAAMAEAGIRTIQMRAKGRSGEAQLRLLAGCLAVLDGQAVDLWIDDRADLAALLPIVGVHVGQRDLPPAGVRQVVGEATWIGLSTHGEAQVEAAELDPEVDLVAVGPVFPTASKERPDPVVGLDFVRRARRLTGKPLVAIGGIGPENVAAVLAAGADSAVVLSAVCRGGLAGIAVNCRRLLACASS